MRLMQLDIKNILEEQMLNSKCKAKQRRKKRKVKKQERIKKHELCPLAKRPVIAQSILAQSLKASRPRLA